MVYQLVSLIASSKKKVKADLIDNDRLLPNDFIGHWRSKSSVGNGMEENGSKMEFSHSIYPHRQAIPQTTSTITIPLSYFHFKLITRPP